MNGKQDKNERFRKALVDARMRKAWGSLIDFNQSESFSEEHKETMRTILSTGRKKPARFNRRQLIASIAAVATVAVAAFALFVNRSAFFPDYSGETPAQPVDKIQSLSYVPEGYEIVYASADLTGSHTKWENPEKQYILFDQTALGSSEQNYDEIEGSHEYIPIGGYSIHCIYTDQASIFVWEFNGYSYKIECSNTLPIDEVTRMIIAFLRDNGYIQ